MLQLFAEGEAAPPALSEAQTRQAVASGTMKPDEAKVPAAPQASAEKTVELQPEKPRQELPVQRPELPPLSSFARSTQAAVHSLHARWAAEEAAMRRSQPDFDLQNELRSPEMRRLMQLPGMRVRDAYRLAHYAKTCALQRRLWSRAWWNAFSSGPHGPPKTASGPAARLPSARM